MATWAIGDVQGCFGAFERLLAAIDFVPGRDRLWLAGDLVNRGPDNLSMLRWCVAHEDHLVSVMGNHDLHLLAHALGVADPDRGDNVDDVLAAPDGAALTQWVRQRPLLHVEGDEVLVHSGLRPQWSLARAAARARELEAIVRGPHLATLLRKVYDPTPPPRSDVDFADLNVFVRLRVCDAAGEPHPTFDGRPEDCPPGYRPWHEHPTVRPRSLRTYFGHWSAQRHGFFPSREDPRYVALDAGCVWGGALTAVRTDDLAVVQVSCGDR